MVSATLGGVIGTGLALGIVHVLTGPDHLSALATLSVGKTARAAFGLGVRWGCGHSFGLLIVAIIFFAVGQSVNIDTLTYWADMFVGFFMIILGLWYIIKAYKDKREIDNSVSLFEETRMINNKNDSETLNSNNENENNINMNINNNNNNAIQLETIDIENDNHNHNENDQNRNDDNKKHLYQNLKVVNDNHEKHIDSNNTNNNNNNSDHRDGW